MIEKVANIGKIPELKKRILFTMGMIAVFRLGAHVPSLGVDPAKLFDFFASKGAMSGVLGFLDLFSGGALKNFSVFALGITPYINSSIIMQLLVYVVPFLEKLSKEGEDGRKKISQYTRWGTVLIGGIQAFGISFMMKNFGILTEQMDANFAFFTIITVITLTAGTSFIMWLGEQITERGIGNGVSLLITISIVSRLPEGAIQTYRKFSDQPTFIPILILIGIFVFALIAAVVFMYEGSRKIPVQYAKRVVGRRVYGGQSTHIPLRVNQAGVIPIIFAASVMVFPRMIISGVQQLVLNNVTMTKFLQNLSGLFSPSAITYNVVYTLLIVGFAYFYTAIVFNPRDMADNMKKYGGFIPGIRAGRPTAEFIDRTMVRITFAGAIFLALIDLVPRLVIVATDVPFYMGGTSILILVGVVLDTVKQAESHLLVRHYEGFLKKRGGKA
ncbi:MAG: preprotein translocase subunit SecY [Candidatus Wallbacteria bacterium]|nr:preprotein translocase subunit SecY [Candidatus Wallbacteria bacterium]